MANENDQCKLYFLPFSFSRLCFNMTKFTIAVCKIIVAILLAELEIRVFGKVSEIVSVLVFAVDVNIRVKL